MSEEQKGFQWSDPARPNPVPPTPCKRKPSRWSWLLWIPFIGCVYAILMPAPHPRGMAKKANCLSNLKQLALALNMYGADFDDRSPLHLYAKDGDGMIDPYGGYGVGTIGVGIFDVLYPYQKNSVIMQCPSTPQAMDYVDMLGVASGGRLQSSATGIRTISYGFNFGLFDNRTFKGAKKIKNLTMEELPLPADTVAFFDGKFASAGSAYPYADLATIPKEYIELKSRYDAPNMRGMARHSDGVCVVYVDGHAKFLKGSGNQPQLAKDNKTKVYRLPYDLHGIPAGEAEPRFY